MQLNAVLGLDLVLMGGAMLSKSLIQFSVDGQGCVPSLLFELRPNYKVKSEVAQSCPTLCNPMDCSLPGFSVHGIFQARVLEWVAITIVWPQVNNREGTQPRPSIENGIKDLLNMALPIRTGPNFPLSLSHQEAPISLLPFSIRQQTDWKPQSQETD